MRDDRDRDPPDAPRSFDFTVTTVDYVIDRPPDPRWQITDLANPRAHLLVHAMSGRAHYLIDGTPYTVEEGAVVFMPKATVHTASSDRERPWHFTSVAFDLVEGGSDSVRQLHSLPAVTYGIPLDVSGVFREMHAAWRRKDPGHLLQIRGAVSAVLFQVIREHTLPELREPHAQRIDAVTRDLLENWDKTYSVAELAAMSGLSPSHFRQTFKRVTGMTAIAYQRYVKITKAVELLTSGEYNVTQTARLTGFRDVYYFSRVFTRVTGVKPSSLSQR